MSKPILEENHLLKNIFYSRERRNNGIISVIPQMEAYISSIMGEDGEDRARNVNSPSSAGYCPIVQIITRFYKKEFPVRTQRVFDNGKDVHLRIQRYLHGARVLLLDEVPLRNDEHNAQGHTDGYLFCLGILPEWWKFEVKYGDINRIYSWLRENPLKSVEILEIKSMNNDQYKGLRTPEEEHKDQATTYAWCADERRKYLKNKYKNWDEFIKSEQVRKEEHRRYYPHLKDPKKVERKLRECLMSDAILYACQNPIERCLFLYENKNDQQIKEFVIRKDESRLNKLWTNFRNIEESFRKIKIICAIIGTNYPDFTNKVFKRLLPPKPVEARGRTCDFCKFCKKEIKDICYGRN